MKKQMSGILALAALALISWKFTPYNWFWWITSAVFLGILIRYLILGIQNWKELEGKASIGLVCLGVVLAFFVGNEQYAKYEGIKSIEQSFSEKRGMTRQEYGQNRLQDIHEKYAECFKKCGPCIRKCDEEYQRKIEETRHMSKDDLDPKSDCGYLRELAIADKAACKAGCTAGCYGVLVEQIEEIGWWLNAYRW